MIICPRCSKPKTAPLGSKVWKGKYCPSCGGEFWTEVHRACKEVSRLTDFYLTLVEEELEKRGLNL